MFVVYSTNNSNVYHVRFDEQNGEKLGESECKASQRGLACYYLVAAKEKRHLIYDCIKDFSDKLKNSPDLSDEQRREITDAIVDANAKMAADYQEAFFQDVRAINADSFSSSA